ncbi:MAG: Blue-light-activated protein [Syntrophorhabdaceae bacterium PtaU1.Bin034]|nr:MAG: Blue-light-activated protein [Syntrophorhabdaceae bacterium PtaU1.Bin034]
MSYRSMPKTVQSLRERMEKMLARGREGLGEETAKEMREHLRELQLHLARIEMENEELRRARLEAEKSRDRYSELYDQAPVGYLVLDEQGVVLDLNSTASNLLGLETTDLPGQPLFPLLHPNFHDAFTLHLTGVLRSSKKQTCEVMVKRRNGDLVHFRVESIAAGTGDRPVIRSVLIDITDLRQSEHELREGAELLRAVIEGTSDAVYVKNARGRYIFLNAEAARAAGRDAAEAIGKDDSFLLPPERAKYARETDRSVMATRKVTTYEETVSTEEGRKKTYLTTKGPLFDSSREVAGVFGISRDITNLKRTQKALVDSEARLRNSLSNTEKLNRDLRQKVEELDTIFNTAPVGIAVSYDPQCLHIKGNETYAAMLGLTPEDNLSKTAPAGQRPHHFKEMQAGRQLMPRELPMQVAASRGLVIRNAEMDLVHDDGRVVRILGNATPLMNEHGRPRGAVGVFLDISELKKTQEDLSKAHKKITKILESITDAFVSFDRCWRYTYVNDTACRLLCRSREELIGQRVLATFPEAVRPRFHTEFIRAMTENAPVHFEEFFSPPDAWYECRCYPSSEGLSVYFQDITDRKKAEEARRRHVIKLDTLLDVSRDVLAASSSEDMLNRVAGAAKVLTGARFAVSAGGDNEGCFRAGVMPQHIEPRFPSQGRLFTLEPEETEDLPTTGERSPGHAGSRLPDRPAWRGVRGGRPQKTLLSAEVHRPGLPDELIMVTGKIEGEFTPEDETILSQLATVASLGLRHIEAKNEVELLVEERTKELRKAYESLRMEMLDRKKAEQQLRRAQKMDALGTMAEGIGHDFNNILAAIIGFTELVYDRLPDESRERRRLQRVLEAGLRGRELVDQMLTFARLGEQEKRALQADGIIRETLKLLRPSIPRTIDIEVSLRNGPGFVLGNPQQLEQVIVNLCNNAAYAMREKGGTLSLELSDFVVEETGDGSEGMRPGTYLRLTVRDTGTGIPAEDMDRIFDPFFTTKDEKGAGLGLSVVHGIVGQTGGHITVESEPGKGSAFNVYLPKLSAKRRGAMGGAQTAPTGRERILFVDDEELLVESGKGLLEGLGYTVTATTSSLDALRTFSSDPHSFDLVITDQTMPDMTGVELAKELTDVRPGIPVILVTGFSYVIDSEAAEKAGINAFAMKPLTKGEIADIIRKTLDAKQEL